MDQKDIKISELKGHLIICGWDRMGGAILHEIEAVSEFWSRGVVVVAETDEDIFASLKIRSTSRCFHVKQDYTKIDVLESVGVKRAASAIVLADKGNALRDQDRDARTVLAALTLEKLNPEIFTIAELLDDQNAGHLHIAGVEEIISRTDITAGLFATDVISHGIGSVVKELLTHRRGNYLKKLPLPDDQTGKSFIEVLTYFKQEYDATIIGVDRKDEKGIFKAKVNPPSDFLLQEDDQLVVVVQRESAMCELDE